MSLQSFVYNPSITTSAATGDGFSVPRNTTVGRLATVFTLADAGMMVFDTDFDNLFIWNGTAWESVPSSGDSTNTQVIFNDNGVLVGDAGLTYDKTTQKLTVGTSINIWRGFLNDSTSVAVGPATLTETIAGAIRNTFVGSNAGQFVSSGNRNVGVGFGAIQSVNGFELTGSQNVGVGTNALAAANTTANNNTAIGNAAGGTITTGAGNVAVGHDALNGAGTTGNNNIAVGNTAMASASTITGADNIGIGRNTLQALTGGNTNISIGPNSLISNATGSNNVAIGGAALNLSTVSDQVAIGLNALLKATVGLNNTAVGKAALSNVITTSNNTALGYQAAQGTTASETTAIGSNALALSTGGAQNVAVGSSAMGAAIVTGGFNTAIGTSAGNSLTSGINNTLIGNNAAANLTIGNANICIGMNATVNVVSDSNTLAIGSSGQFVATNGGATTYYATATAGAIVPLSFVGYMRIRLNGTFVKVPIYND